MHFTINKLWLEGLVKTRPVIRSLSERTKVTAFTLSVFESWVSRDGETKFHRNDIPVEILGREAEAAHRHLRPGDRVSIDGYLRSEVFKGSDKITVRVFNISYEERDGQEQHGGSPRKAP